MARDSKPPKVTVDLRTITEEELRELGKGVYEELRNRTTKEMQRLIPEPSVKVKILVRRNLYASALDTYMRENPDVARSDAESAIRRFMEKEE